MVTYILLLLQVEDFPEIEPWLDKRDYISHDIINELIKMMGQEMPSKI